MKKVITMLLLSVLVVALSGSAALAAVFEAWHGTGTLQVVDPTNYWGNGINATSSTTPFYDGPHLDPAYNSTIRTVWSWQERNTGRLLFEGDLEFATVPTMTQTIGGLDPSKSYDVYVQYSGPPSSHAAYTTAWPTYGVRASIQGGVSIDATNFDDDLQIVQVLSGTLESPYQCIIEKLIDTVTGVSQVAVDISQDYTPEPGQAVTNRCRYLGLSINEIPEPATLGLLLMGGLALLSRGRKKSAFQHVSKKER